MSPLAKLLEAALFAASRPLTLEELLTLEPEAGEAGVRAAMAELAARYTGDEHGVELVEIAEGWQFLTRREFAEALERAQFALKPRRLSPAALETLAIIAYKQPIKRVDLEAIRGAASGELIRALMERNLVKIAGREEIPGSPLQYGTTKEFLDTFGINSLEDLPRPEEVK